MVQFVYTWCSFSIKRNVCNDLVCAPCPLRVCSKQSNLKSVGSKLDRNRPDNRFQTMNRVKVFLVKALRLSKDQRYKPLWEVLQRHPSALKYLVYYAISVVLLAVVSFLYARYYHCCFRAKSRLLEEREALTRRAGCSIRCCARHVSEGATRSATNTSSGTKDPQRQAAGGLGGYQGISVRSPGKIELAVRHSRGVIDNDAGRVDA
jgi:hypothetical protein